MTSKINFATSATVVLTVSQMLTISIALGEAAEWNDANDYPVSGNELRALRVELRKQFAPYFNAIDSDAVAPNGNSVGTIDRQAPDLFDTVVEIVRPGSAAR